MAHGVLPPASEAAVFLVGCTYRVSSRASFVIGFNESRSRPTQLLPRWAQVAEFGSQLDCVEGAGQDFRARKGEEMKVQRGPTH